MPLVTRSDCNLQLHRVRIFQATHSRTQQRVTSALHSSKRAFMSHEPCLGLFFVTFMQDTLQSFFSNFYWNEWSATFERDIHFPQFQWTHLTVSFGWEAREGSLFVSVVVTPSDWTGRLGRVSTWKLSNFCSHSSMLLFPCLQLVSFLLHHNKFTALFILNS